MRQSFIGPLGVDTFLNDFLPIEDDLPPSVTEGFMQVARASTERKMYDPFVCPPIPSF
jgi:hypothetical protein